jgi:hyperosmotically inducible protein
MKMSLNRVFITFFWGFLLSVAGCEKDGSGDRTGQPPTPETERSGTGLSTTQGSENTATGSVADPTRAGGEDASGTGREEGAGPGTGGPPTSPGSETSSENLGSGMEKAGDYMDDSVITAKIKQDILSDPLLKSTQIDVETENGVVKLSGTVDSQLSIDRVKALAQSVTDVKAVESELVISESAK